MNIERKKYKHKKYTQKMKIGILKILERNNFNYLQTSKLTNVTRATLKKWVVQYGPEVFSGKSPAEVALKEVDAEMKINDTKIIKKYYNVRSQLLDRIQELISHETKLEPLVNALKSISRDLGLLDDLEKKEKESGSSGKSFIEMFNMQIEAMGKENLLPYEEDYSEKESDEDERE